MNEFVATLASKAGIDQGSVQSGMGAVLSTLQKFVPTETFSRFASATHRECRDTPGDRVNPFLTFSTNLVSILYSPHRSGASRAISRRFPTRALQKSAPDRRSRSSPGVWTFPFRHDVLDATCPSERRRCRPDRRGSRA